MAFPYAPCDPRAMSSRNEYASGAVVRVVIVLARLALGVLVEEPFQGVREPGSVRVCDPSGDARQVPAT